MIATYAQEKPELLGIAPLIVPLITAGTTIGSLIAGAVVARRQQKRGIAASKEAQANALKLAELEARRQKLADEKKMQTTAIAIGIPAALGAAMFLMGSK